MIIYQDIDILYVKYFLIVSFWIHVKVLYIILRVPSFSMQHCFAGSLLANVNIALYCLLEKHLPRFIIWSLINIHPLWCPLHPHPELCQLLQQDFSACWVHAVFSKISRSRHAELLRETYHRRLGTIFGALVLQSNYPANIYFLINLCVTGLLHVV